MSHKRKQVPKRLRFEVLKRDGFTCQYCGRSAPHVRLHVDHIHPVAWGGITVMGNLITACQGCNIGKSDVLLTNRETGIPSYAIRSKTLDQFTLLRLPDAVSDQLPIAVHADSIVQGLARAMNRKAAE